MVLGGRGVQVLDSGLECVDTKRMDDAKLNTDGTYLEAGAGRMALLLLAAINSGRLPAGALAARGLALATSHC